MIVKLPNSYSGKKEFINERFYPVLHISKKFLDDFDISSKITHAYRIDDDFEVVAEPYFLTSNVNILRVEIEPVKRHIKIIKEGDEVKKIIRIGDQKSFFHYSCDFFVIFE